MGLVGYDSSDEDDDVVNESGVQQSSINATEKSTTEPKASSNNIQHIAKEDNPPTPIAGKPPAPPPPNTSTPTPVSTTTPTPAPAPTAPLGPKMGPSRLPATDQESTIPSLPDLVFLPSGDNDDNNDDPEPPKSPYSTTRALLRDLTLPPLANTDMPPSPPGTPPPEHANLTRRFDALLALKRTGQQHFNARLAASTGMRNPALADKLLAFAGVGGGGSTADADDDGGASIVAQYATVLGAPCGWHPQALPAAVYRRGLRRSQERIRRARERGKGEAVAFVPGVAAQTGIKAGAEATATATASPAKSQAAPVTGKRKTRFD